MWFSSHHSRRVSFLASSRHTISRANRYSAGSPCITSRHPFFETSHPHCHTALGFPDLQIPPSAIKYPLWDLLVSSITVEEDRTCGLGCLGSVFVNPTTRVHEFVSHFQIYIVHRGTPGVEFIGNPAAIHNLPNEHSQMPGAQRRQLHFCRKVKYCLAVSIR